MKKYLKNISSETDTQNDCATQNQLRRQADRMYGLNVFLTCILILVVPTANAGSFKLTNLRCSSLNQSLGKFQICSLKAVKRDVVELNAHFALVQNPIRNATLLFRLMRRGNHAQKPLYQFKVDLCAFLASSRRNPWANLFYTMFEFQKYSNINHSCPFDHDIIIRRCRVNTNLLNVLSIAPGEYTIYTNWSLYDKLAANIDVSVKID